MIPNLDNQMKLWIGRMWERGIFLADRVIQEKAFRSQSTMNDGHDLQDMIDLRFSNGWLYLFNSRHKCRCYKSHGEESYAEYIAAR